MKKAKSKCIELHKLVVEARPTTLSTQNYVPMQQNNHDYIFVANVIIFLLCYMQDLLMESDMQRAVWGEW